MSNLLLYSFSLDLLQETMFATHQGTKTFAIVDLKMETALFPVTVGTAQAVAIDRRDNKIFPGDVEEHKVVISTVCYSACRMRVLDRARGLYFRRTVSAL